MLANGWSHGAARWHRITGAVVTPEALPKTGNVSVRLTGFGRKHPLSCWATVAAVSPFAKTMPSRSYRLKSWTEKSPLGVWCPHLWSTPAASDADSHPGDAVNAPSEPGRALTASALPPDVMATPAGDRCDQATSSRACHPSADAKATWTDIAARDRSALDISPSRSREGRQAAPRNF